MEEVFGGCIGAAKELREKRGGSVYWVESVGHAYFVPRNVKFDDPALNHADNGYSRFPRMSVRDVILNGQLVIWTPLII